MRKSMARLIACLGIGFIVGCAAPEPAPPPPPAPDDGADVVIIGTVRTMDDRAPEGGALVLKGGVVERVTTADVARSRITAHTRVIEVPPSGVVLPGFIESHAHLRSIGRSMRQLDLGGTASADEAAARVGAAAATAPAGSWILGRGWNQERWADKNWPTRAQLDAVAQDHPVALSRADGHALWVNSLALARAHITAATANPAGGEILRDAAGEPTGVLVDNAMDVLSPVVESGATPEDVATDCLRAQDAAFRNGITTLVDCGDSAENYLRLAALYDQGNMKLRVYGMLGCSTIAELDAVFARAPVLDHRGGSLAVRAIKMYADGALGSRGAWLLAPYADREGHSGLPVTDQSVLEYAARGALQHGYQLCVHAIGDRANREVLDVVAAALKGVKTKPDHRFRIEHAQLVDPADIPRFHKLGVIPSMQPCHATSDAPWVAARLGADRTQKTAYPWRALFETWCHLPAGTDAPVEPLSTTDNYYSAIMRLDPHGRLAEPFQPEKRMNRLEALLAMTRYGAEATFSEGRRGMLAPGFDGDVVILDHDLLTCHPDLIASTTTLYTIVAGVVVYQGG